MAWVLKQMHQQAKKRDAPVFRAEHSTRATPFTILVFTMLSARTKDETTARVVAELFRKAKTPSAIRKLGRIKLEKLLFGIGFYRVKAKNLLEVCKIIGKKGSVPDTIGGLMELPGVGRKTANIVLARAFGKSALGVDVHVHRISNRLGIVKTKKPEDTEKALIKVIPRRYIRTLNRDFVAFGQTVCLPRNPQCPICPLNQLCRRIGVEGRCEQCKY